MPTGRDSAPEPTICPWALLVRVRFLGCGREREAHQVLLTSLLMSLGPLRTFKPASVASLTYSGCVQRGGRSIPSVTGRVSLSSPELRLSQVVTPFHEHRSKDNPAIAAFGSTIRTFDGLDVVGKAIGSQIFSLEPVRQGQLATWPEHLVSVVEEQSFVREMAQRLADPDRIELGLLLREELAHPLGVELDELDPPLTDGQEALRVRLGVRWAVWIGRRVLGGGCLGQARSDLDLLPRDGDAGHGAPQLGRQVPRGAADAAADIQHMAASGDLGHAEEELDQVDLGDFLAVVGLGLLGGPVAMVDVLSPGCGAMASEACHGAAEVGRGARQGEGPTRD